MNTVELIVKSWAEKNSPIISMEEILNWISNKNSEIVVNIHRTKLEEDDFWFYDRVLVVFLKYKDFVK